jgi:hypothetical protein
MPETYRLCKKRLLIQTLRRIRQEDHKFKTGMGYIARLTEKQKKSFHFLYNFRYLIYFHNK